jgi:hypothetical protein
VRATLDELDRMAADPYVAALSRALSESWHAPQGAAVTRRSVR